MFNFYKMKESAFNLVTNNNIIYIENRWFETHKQKLFMNIKIEIGKLNHPISIKSTFVEWVR